MSDEPTQERPDEIDLRTATLDELIRALPKPLKIDVEYSEFHGRETLSITPDVTAALAAELERHENKHRAAIAAAGRKRAQAKEANRARVRALRDGGKPPAQIAQEVHLSERYVRHLLSDKGGSDRS